MPIKPHEKTLILADFIRGKQAGDTISFLEIEQITGITMDVSGKQYLRSALKMTETPFLSVRGYGIELVSENTSVEAVGVQFCKIDRSVKRGRKITQTISNKFNTKMNEHDRSRVMQAVAIFGAIEASADSFRAMRKLDKYRLKQIKPYSTPDVSSYK